MTTRYMVSTACIALETLEPRGAGRHRGKYGEIVLITDPPAPTARTRRQGRGRSSSAATNLPAELSAFFDRRQILVRARTMLGERRLLTLTGTGGVGKTRLAFRIASSTRPSFQEGGVWLVELGTLREPALVPRAVADVLDVADRGRHPLVSVLIDRLASARTLLLLDNCEHLLDATAYLAESLLRACPHLHILTTSREPLGLAGEAVLQVPPLARSDARQLFLERAAAACAYAPEPTDEPKIDELCERLDRLPLALELAAGRVKMISVADMTARIESGLGLEGVGKRGGVPRQRTLRATLDWSHELLAPSEQLAWRRLAFFESSFGLDAAEAVVGEGALELVAALVDKSILNVDMRGRHARYRMLETVRRYGQERLEASEERPEVERRMVAFYLRLAEEADRRQAGAQDRPGPPSDSSPGWAAELDEEQGNLRRALTVAGRLEGDLRLRLAIALVAYWDLRGHLEEGRRWLERALAPGGYRRPGFPGAAALRGEAPLRIKEQADPHLLGLALDGTGWISFRQNDYTSAESFFERAREVADAAGDRQVLARATCNLGLVRIVTGRIDEAERFLRRSLGISRTAGLRSEETGPLFMLSLLSYVSGDITGAVDHARSCLVVARSVGNLKTIAMAVAALGNLHVELGELDDARLLLDEALQIASTIEAKVDTVLILGACARLAEHEKDHARCLELAAAAARLALATGAGPVAIWQWRVEEAVDAARTALGHPRADAAWARGSLLDAGGAIRLARGQERDAPVAGEGNERLTRRELEIATLVADGLSNRAIAERLLIAPRTVETHVENIFNKLGFRSRSEVAAWNARRPARP